MGLNAQSCHTAQIRTKSSRLHSTSNRNKLFGLIALLGLASGSVTAATPEQTLATLRLAGTITGGLMPSTAPEYAQMLAAVERNDFYGAALIAAQSSYAANFILRRLALQMQNLALESNASRDNDATAFLIAHFAGVGGVGAPSISKIWSNDFTCQVRNAAGVLVRPNQLTAGDLRTIDWRTALVCNPGQQAFPLGGADGAPRVAIPTRSVGGYMTLSSGPGDLSFAQNSLMAGTNLRFVLNMWEIATGLTILEFASSEARSQVVPRFVSINDPNFLVGQGQTACIACHGGGIVSTTHGYSTVADVFDFTDQRGIVFQPTPATNQRKSLGSNPNTRQQTLTCNLANFQACNPESTGVDPNQGWDLASNWGARGFLTKLGWNGPMVGQGLNSLGAALGRATIVYTNFVKRIIREVCPLGAVPNQDINSIAAVGQSTDDIRQMIAHVASNPACR